MRNIERRVPPFKASLRSLQAPCHWTVSHNSVLSPYLSDSRAVASLNFSKLPCISGLASLCRATGKQLLGSLAQLLADLCKGNVGRPHDCAIPDRCVCVLVLGWLPHHVASTRGHTAVLNLLLDCYCKEVKPPKWHLFHPATKHYNGALLAQLCEERAIEIYPLQ